MDSAATVNAQGFPYEAKIWENTSTEDSGGDAREGFTAGDTVPCRIGPVGTSPQGVRGGAVSEATTHVVTFAREVSIKTSDELEIAGKRYAITANASYGSWESAKRVEVRAL